MACPKPTRLLCHLQRRRFCTVNLFETPLHLAVRSAVECGDHRSIPSLLPDSSNPIPNPFSFLSLLPPTLAAATITDLLHSFASLRPRSLPYPAYVALLSLTLPNPIPDPPLSSVLFPPALAVLQSTLRSGRPPLQETRLSLPLNWLALRRRCSVAAIISSLRLLGFRVPDLNTLNYLISSLCATGETEEAAALLRGMSAAGIDPDSASYCEVIEAIGGGAAAELLVEMVVARGMAPRRGTVARVAATMGTEGEARRAAELLRLLEREGCVVGFEAYEAVAEGCLERGDVVAAARVVAEMAQRGFAPYIGVRRRVVEGLAAIGQEEIAGDIRRRLAEIRS
ncbi:pentatricopeptide repeat-containing protein [Canna indica]|uniref:Pentatricopeptide repeat-containing protein n=1 Tax=Canna indica TaxID=4628 RepID=A0AAQ3KXV0_9LILI|nr:pentatricopeptide repeat-containing protein [Canna indica]